MQCNGPLINTHTHTLTVQTQWRQIGMQYNTYTTVLIRVSILIDFYVNEFKPINGHNSAIVWPNQAKLKKINKHNRANNKSKKLNF